MEKKRIIGHKEVLDLPELGLYNIEAKIDTGAETSVLHCDDMEVLTIKGHMYINAYIRPDQEHDKTIKLTFPVHRERTVKSSFGQSEIRHIFLTKVRLFDELFDIKLSFRNRSNMSYPMLLGRNFITGKFLVDVSKKNLAANII